jgi:hypothetical protein
MHANAGKSDYLLVTQGGFMPKSLNKKDSQELAPIEEDEDFSFEDPGDEGEQLDATIGASEAALDDLDQDDIFSTFDPDAEDDVEADQINDPRITHLEDPPILGGRGRDTDLFGARATTPIGRAMSPRLYAQASQFPTCSQLRIWKWENGVPVGLGAIDAMATEEDMVRQFFDAMPRKGEGRCQYKLRPIDINGQEMGQEISVIISEHHAAIQKIKRMKKEEELEEQGGGMGVLGNQQHFYEVEKDDTAATMASEMSRMFDRMMDMSDRKNNVLEESLEEERTRLREQELERAQERVDLATNAAQGVQALTERMMQDESRRAERSMKMQNEQSQTLLTTLTSIFAQQQQMMQSSFEGQRRSDQFRLEQERERARRDREEYEERRHRERLELEERRLRERDEADRRLREDRAILEAKITREQNELQIRLERERQEMQMKMQREQSEREARERWFAEERLRREEREQKESKEREAERQRRHDLAMSEMKQNSQRDREHAERMMALSKMEISNKAMGGLGEMIPKATGMLREIGIEPAHLIQRALLPPEEEPEKSGGWMEALPSIIGATAEIAKSALGGGGLPQPQLAPPQMAMQQYPQLTDDAYRQYAEPMQQPRPATQIMQQAQQVPAEQQMEPEVAQAEEPYNINQDQNGDPSYLIEQKEATVAPPQAVDVAEQAGIDLERQKKAREGMMYLVTNLAQSPQDRWQDIITGALAQNIDIYTYISAVTVRYAIRETGAPEDLVEAIVLALQQSALVPADLPYGA